MRKELKIIGSKERHVFTATFIRFGFRDGYKGLSLRDRTWVCPACGAVNDRDILAARNILRKGISELESMGNSNDSNVGVSCVCIQESHLL